MKRYHLIGIGGSGMNALAQILVHEGISVSGSDRSYDRGENAKLFNKLKNLGVKICPQDGNGVIRGVDRIIASKAVEEDNPDIISAKRLGIPISYRQDELKKIFNRYSGIAVAGTSGKTTVVGMIGSIFDAADHGITIINGGIIKNYISKKDIGNVHIGRMPYLCIETDESEGDLKGYNAQIGVLTNIGLDHMPYERAMQAYKDFANEVKDKFVVNKDFEIKRKGENITFGIENNADVKAYDIKILRDYSTFKIDRSNIKIYIPGLFNIYNALAAMGAAKAWGISIKNIKTGLERFKGIKRRFELLGEINGARVIDDFAHNPDKIKAALETAHLGNGRVIAVYQPHGYGPTKMFLNELADAFTGNMTAKDLLFIPDIYYAGGTVRKDISSADLVNAIKERNKKLKVEYMPKRDQIIKIIHDIIKNGDTVLVMGARDVTLQDWARKILK